MELSDITYDKRKARLKLLLDRYGMVHKNADYYTNREEYDRWHAKALETIKEIELSDEINDYNKICKLLNQ